MWFALLAEFGFDDLSNNDLITFKTRATSGRLLDRRLVKEEAIEQGAVAGLASANWIPRSATGHAQPALRLFPHKIGAVSFPEFQCIPAAVLKGEYPPSVDLARDLNAFEHIRSAQRDTNVFTAIAWSWRRGEPKCLTEPLRFAGHSIRKAALQHGKMARVPLQELRQTMRVASLHVCEHDLESRQDPEFVMAPTTLLRELSLVLRVIAIEDSLFRHDQVIGMRQAECAPGCYFSKTKRIRPPRHGTTYTIGIWWTKAVEQALGGTSGHRTHQSSVKVSSSFSKRMRWLHPHSWPCNSHHGTGYVC